MGKRNGMGSSRRRNSDRRFDKYEKIYVFDTSVLVHDPLAIEKFKDNIIVVPIWLIAELDQVKKQPSDRGESAREASRRLDDYLKNGSLAGGIETRSHGLLLTHWNGVNFDDWPSGLERNNDARIIMVARQLAKQFPAHRVVLVSKDRNQRILADAMKVRCEDYVNDKVISSIGELYTGAAEVRLEDGEEHFLTQLHQYRKLCAKKLSAAPDIEMLNTNQCCRLIHREGNKQALAIFKKEQFEFRLVEKEYPFGKSRGVWPRNDEQHFLYHLLCDPQISLVTAVGKAGTGKTLISLLAGINQLEDETCSMLQVYRPMSTVDKDLGILPGGVDDKFAPWSAPILDNLQQIRFNPGAYEGGKDERKIKHNRPMREMIQPPMSKALKQILESGLIEIGPLTYIRGRSLPNRMIIIDEAQNITPHTAKTAITRAGEGAKVVLLGDPHQIDNPHLDSLSCGLSYVIERFKGRSVHGHITLKKSERSHLAELAANIL